MTERFAKLKRITNQAELDCVKTLAQQESHGIVAPSHAVWKDGKIVGHMCIGNIPVIIGHLSQSSELMPRDSFNIIHISEQLLENSGAQNILMPIGADSPFYNLMMPMGYKNLAVVNLFAKDL